MDRDGADATGGWVARLVSRVPDGNGGVAVEEIVSTASVLGHSYLARAAWVRFGYASEAVEPDFQPNYDLAFTTRQMEEDFERLDFSVSDATLGLLDASRQGLECWLEVAGSPIGKPAAPVRRRTMAYLPWLSCAAYGRLRVAH